MSISFDELTKKLVTLRIKRMRLDVQIAETVKKRQEVCDHLWKLHQVAGYGLSKLLLILNTSFID